MTDPTPDAQKGNLPYAALAAAFGVFFILLGARLLPVSGAAAKLNGPNWLALCVGLAFLLAGLAIAVQTLGHANAGGELPAAAPRWMRAVQTFAAVAIVTCLGAIGSWVAFGPGERNFSGSFLLFGPEVNSMIGRAAFGFGAMIIWLCLAVVVASGLHKFFGKRKPDAG